MKTIEIQYAPHQYQRQFHDSIAPRRLLLAGIRGGKTVAGVNECIKTALKGKPGRFGAPNVGAIVAATYPMLRDVVIPEFFGFCPRELILKYNISEMTAILINGSKIMFRSADYPDRLRGLDLQWFWIDEAAIAKPDAYNILLGRIAQKKGICWITTTPKGFNWVYKEFFKRWQQGDKDYDVIIFRSIDNPYFPVEEIDRLQRTYSPDFYQQEVEAKFVLFAGIVYKDFNPLIHVQNLDPQKSYKDIIAGVDWGYTNPTCILVIGIDADGKKHVAREWFESERVIDEITRVAQQLAKEHHITMFYCDPSEPSFIDQFRRAGLTARPANNEVMPGINAVTESLRKNELAIDARCTNLIEEFQNYQYPETHEEKPIQEQPVKVNDHALDALRYVLASYIPRSRVTIR